METVVTDMIEEKFELLESKVNELIDQLKAQRVNNVNLRNENKELRDENSSLQQSMESLQTEMSGRSDRENQVRERLRTIIDKIDTLEQDN